MSVFVSETWENLPSRRELCERLDRLDMPADAKVAVAELINTTAMAGDRVIDIGRRIVAFAFELIRELPHLTFCLIIALILNVLIASVPLLGPLLSAILGPLLLVAGIGLGALMELNDGDMRARTDRLTRELQAVFA